MSELKIKIAITDDHPIVSQGLSSLLSKETDFEVCGVFAQAAQLLEWLKKHTVDIILLDIYLQDANGLDICKTLKSMYPDTGIIAISGQNEGVVISQMLQNGARGYVLKHADSEEIIEAIRTVFGGEQFLCKRTRESLQKLDRQMTALPRITRREKEVLRLIADGQTTAEIAALLFISPHTVESHRKNLMEKFQAKSTTSVINTVKNLGLL
ncbi:response regulator transcription factor [Niabella terrae]